MEHVPPLSGFLAAVLSLGLVLIGYYAAVAFLARLFQATVALSRVMGEAIGIGAAWPVEKAIDQLDRWVARGMEWRAQRRIWRTEFRDSLSWQDFQQQLRGKAARDEVGEALNLLALAEPFTRADLDARFKRIIAGVHPDKGGSPVLARMADRRPRPDPQAKRMEEMSDHKTALALQRDGRLAALRARMDRPERFTLRFACAERDLDYNVTFARLSATARFTCEKIEPAPRPTAGLFRGLFGPRGDRLRMPAGEIEFSGMSCAGCGQQSSWTQCSGCGAFICGASTRSGLFRCRASCRASGEVVPLAEISAERTADAAKAIGHAGRAALPIRRGGKP